MSATLWSAKGSVSGARPSRPIVTRSPRCLSPAAAQDSGRLTVELNKLEPGQGGACRAFFLFRNDSGASMEGFEMSLAVMNSDGVIDQLVTVDAAPIPVARTTLKLFEFPDVACGDISELLLHDVGACRPQNGAEMDCFDILDLTSKSAATLVK